MVGYDFCERRQPPCRLLFLILAAGMNFGPPGFTGTIGSSSRARSASIGASGILMNFIDQSLGVVEAAAAARAVAKR